MASTINADDGVVSGSAGVKTSADNSGVLELQSNGTTQFTLGSSSVVINESGADVDFRIESDTNANAFFLDGANGNIGIGTSSPSTYGKFAVVGSGTTEGLAVNTSTTGQASWFSQNDAGTRLGVFTYGSTQAAYGAIDSGEGAVYSNRAFTLMSDLAAGVIKFAVGGNTESMRLTSTGLGIGTSSPAAKLGVAGNIFVSGATPYISFDTTQSGSTPAFIQYASSALTFGAGSAERMRITSAGNVGIGTSSPAAKLAVVGDILATGYLRVENSSVGGVFDVGGNNGLTVRGSAAATPNTIIAYTTGFERMRIDSSGHQIVGYTASVGTAYQPNIQVKGGSASNYGAYGVISSNNELLGMMGVYSNNENSLWLSADPDNLRTGSRIVFAVDATDRMTLDSSGNLGLGPTPSAWGLGKAFEVGNAGNAIWGVQASDIRVCANMYYDGTNYKYVNTNFAARYDVNGGGTGGHAWLTAPSGTAGTVISWTQAMTLTAAGNLGVGTTSPSVNGIDIVRSGGTSTYVRTSDGTYTMFSGVAPALGGGLVGTISNSPLILYANNAERARITAGGYSKFSNDGSYIDSAGNYHEFRQTTNDAATIYASNTNASSPYGLRVHYTAAAPNNTDNWFLFCGDSSTRAVIRSNGGLANYQSNNLDLSDERTKKDITPAPSYWDKIGALEIVTYKYNDQTHDDVNVGVIAQQVEAVEPVWVDSDGFGETPEGEEPLKTVYTKDITFAAIKALQEAMTRIEELEAKVAALESK